ncbi:uncharacterized protein VP01_2508g1 [Puccinia sorghi]|uniref:Uncharacterized protein n=1 Tax=Puccinia sorghi TaxID=27349 RepID=A0A0L6V5L9_9BASI|nr:uncharacterized protein VP01_2508g1 [Puccinia sorghi]
MFQQAILLQETCTHFCKHEATKILCGSTYPTLNTVLPVYLVLIQHLHSVQRVLCDPPQLTEPARNMKIYKIDSYYQDAIKKLVYISLLKRTTTCWSTTSSRYWKPNVKHFCLCSDLTKNHPLNQHPWSHDPAVILSPSYIKHPNVHGVQAKINQYLKEDIEPKGFNANWRKKFPHLPLDCILATSCSPVSIDSGTHLLEGLVPGFQWSLWIVLFYFFFYQTNPTSQTRKMRGNCNHVKIRNYLNYSCCSSFMSAIYKKKVIKIPLLTVSLKHPGILQHHSDDLIKGPCRVLGNRPKEIRYASTTGLRQPALDRPRTGLNCQPLDTRCERSKFRICLRLAVGRTCDVQGHVRVFVDVVVGCRRARKNLHMLARVCEGGISGFTYSYIPRLGAALLESRWGTLPIVNQCSYVVLFHHSSPFRSASESYLVAITLHFPGIYINIYSSLVSLHALRRDSARWRGVFSRDGGRDFRLWAAMLRVETGFLTVSIFIIIIFAVHIYTQPCCCSYFAFLACDCTSDISCCRPHFCLAAYINSSFISLYSGSSSALICFILIPLIPAGPATNTHIYTLWSEPRLNYQETSADRLGTST